MTGVEAKTESDYPLSGMVARAMLREYIDEVVAKSRDTCAEIIQELRGTLKVKRIDLKEFDWMEYPTIIAMSFSLVNDETNIRHLFSPKHSAWQTSCDSAYVKEA
jgi:hypothetical protein